jgi:hypothetical protein
MEELPGKHQFFDDSVDLLNASTLSVGMDSQLEELIFELKIEKAKNAKLVREWQGRKRQYEGEIHLL